MVIRISWNRVERKADRDARSLAKGRGGGKRYLAKAFPELRGSVLRTDLDAMFKGLPISYPERGES
jgi:hypothetical protein